MIVKSITQAVSEANSQRVNAIFSGLTDELRALINTLFGNGEQGAMYVPKPVVSGNQVLYQDAAGTVPVSADGDPVGLMLDLSGNGNHASQSVNADRPVYGTDGTLHWLTFNGVNTFLEVASLDLSMHSSVYLGLSAFRKSQSSRQYAFSFRKEGMGSFAHRISTGSNEYVAQSTGDEIVPELALANNASAQEIRVSGGVANIQSPYVRLRLDGSVVDSNTNSQGVGSYGSGQLAIGDDGNLGGFIDADVYGLAFALPEVSLEAVLEADHYLGKLAGITL